MAQWLEQSGASSVIGILAYNRRTRLIVACATAFFWLIFVLLLVDALVSSDTQPGDYWLLALPLLYASPASVWAWQMSRPAVLTPTELIAPRFMFGARRIPVAAIDEVQISYAGRGRRGIKVAVSGKTHLLWPTETVAAMRRQKRDAARGSEIPIESAASAIRAASVHAKQPRTSQRGPRASPVMRVDVCRQTGKEERQWPRPEHLWLLACACGEVGCWPLAARVVALNDTVMWMNFSQDHRPGWDYSEFGPFVFARAQYQRAVAWAANEAADELDGDRARR